jgi:catechol 2,3-dioxygenase-like lactoylglutathione lyase family enzyme
VIDFSELFHTGVRVPDLDKAMHELGDRLGLSWATVCEWQQPVWTPERGAETYALRFTYSTEGPMHVELLDGAPGSPWHAGDAPGAHHLGVWVDDVAASVEELVTAGWRVVAASATPDEGFGAFAYVAPPSGLIVEVVASRAEPRFEAWWAGASLG